MAKTENFFKPDSYGFYCLIKKLDGTCYPSYFLKPPCAYCMANQGREFLFLQYPLPYFRLALTSATNFKESSPNALVAYWWG